MNTSNIGKRIVSGAYGECQVLDENQHQLKVELPNGLKTWLSKAGNLHYLPQSPLAERARIKAENERLREALTAVLRYCVTVEGMPDQDKGRTPHQSCAMKQARQALNQS